MDGENRKEVRFDKYCQTCKHLHSRAIFNPNAGTYDSETGWSGIYTMEEFNPCCYCLEEGMREGTELPVEWEEK